MVKERFIKDKRDARKRSEKTFDLPRQRTFVGERDTFKMFIL